MRHALIISMLLLATAPACSQQETAETTTKKADPEAGCGTELMRPRGSSATSSPIETKVRTTMPNTVKSEEEWRRLLTPEQFRVLREKGTEPAFTGAFYRHDQVGNYRCAGCGSLLFTSREKYHSGSGWPSFNAPAEAGTLTIQTDHSYGMTRDEVLCANCGGHLGHVFDDGPKPTGKRYCINSASLEFEEDANERER